MMKPNGKGKFELNGNKIKVKSSNREDIGQILKFEEANNQYVHQYSRNKHLDLLNDKDCLHLSIFRKDNDTLIGHIIAFGLENKNKVFEFRRLTIHEKGNGFGKEAVRLVQQLCFETLKFHRLWLDVYDDNDRAIHVYEKTGMKLEGILRENIFERGLYRSQRIYAMLEGEYFNQQKF